MITIADFRTRYTEFSDIVLYPDARIQLFIDDAVIWMNEESRWLTFYSLAQNCLVAHFLAVSDASATGDSNSLFPVKKQDVDDVIIESAVSDIAPTMDNMFSTTYGQCYDRYRRMVFTGIYGV